jgi:hypothetical protein
MDMHADMRSPRAFPASDDDRGSTGGLERLHLLSDAQRGNPATVCAARGADAPRPIAEGEAPIPAPTTTDTPDVTVQESVRCDHTRRCDSHNSYILIADRLRGQPITTRRSLTL